VCLPLLIFPCTIKSRSSLLAPAHPGGRGKMAIKRVRCGGGGKVVTSCFISKRYSKAQFFSTSKQYDEANVSNLVLRFLLKVLGKHGVEVLTASGQVCTVDIERLSLHHQLCVTHQSFLPQPLESLDYCNSMLTGLVTPPMLAGHCR